MQVNVYVKKEKRKERGGNVNIRGPKIKCLNISFKLCVKSLKVIIFQMRHVLFVSDSQRYIVKVPIAGCTITNLRFADDTPLITRIYQLFEIP